MVQATELAVTDSVATIQSSLLTDTVVTAHHPETQSEENTTSTITPGDSAPSSEEAELREERTEQYDAPVGMRTGLPYPQSENLAQEGDSIIAEKEPVYGLLLTNPETPQAAVVKQASDLGISYILGGLFILFLVIALRFRNNVKYAVTMFRTIIETRTRQNVFNDTVRETSLIVMLNVLWCASAGIIGFGFYNYVIIDASATPSHPSIGMLIGMAIAAVYTLFMWGAYSCIGWIFSDREHAELWVKGFSANQALMAPAFFLVALVAICQPGSSGGAALTAIIVFFIGKLVFIWKGYRIFFSQISSWVLFLCYLCSLEIVPLIISYRFAFYIGA